MSKFNALPTEDRFLSLTNDQIMFIVASMQLDAEDAKRGVSDSDETFHDEGFDEWLEQVEEEDGERYF